MRVKLLHTVVNESENRCTWLEPESLNKALSRLEATRQRHVELFSFLAREFGSHIEHAVASLSVDQIVENHQLVHSLAILLWGEQSVSVLYGSHIVPEFFIVPDDTNTSVYACLYLNCPE